MARTDQARVYRAVKPFGRAEVYNSIRVLAKKIKRRNLHIDQIIATIDPQAGGAYYVAAELYRLLSHSSTIPHRIDFLLVKGRRGYNRKVSAIPRLNPSVKTILLVGDASFSGNTRQITQSAIQKKYPDVTVLTATLTAGKKKPDFYVQEVTEREVRFPWGQVDPTGEYDTPLDLTGTSESLKFGYRVWGQYEEFALNQSCTARMLTVLPRRRLSLQVHFRRDELFVVLDKNTCLELGNVYEGERKLTITRLKELVARTPGGGKSVRLRRGRDVRTVVHRPKVGDYVLVPRGTLHRLSSRRGIVRVVEISFGFYDQIGDIARLEDDYGRVGLSGRF